MINSVTVRFHRRRHYLNNIINDEYRLKDCRHAHKKASGSISFFACHTQAQNHSQVKEGAI